MSNSQRQPHLQPEPQRAAKNGVPETSGTSANPISEQQQAQQPVVMQPARPETSSAPSLPAHARTQEIAAASPRRGRPRGRGAGRAGPRPSAGVASGVYASVKPGNIIGSTDLDLDPDFTGETEEEETESDPPVRKRAGGHGAGPGGSRGTPSGSAQQAQQPPKRKRRPRAPGAPPRPQGPYMHFLADYRIEHAAELKRMRAADVGRAAGAAWRELPREQREVYERRSEEEKARYAVAMESFNQEQAQVQAQEHPGKKQRVEGQPARPKGAFLYFLDDFKEERRRQFPGEKLPVMQLSKLAGEVWREMDTAARRPYTEKAEAGKSEYQVWKEEMQAEEQRLAQEEAARAQAQRMAPTGGAPVQQWQWGTPMPYGGAGLQAPQQAQHATEEQISRALAAAGIVLSDEEKRRLAGAALQSGFAQQLQIPAPPPPPPQPPAAIAGTFLPPFLPHHPVLSTMPQYQIPLQQHVPQQAQQPLRGTFMGTVFSGPPPIQTGAAFGLGGAPPPSPTPEQVVVGPGAGGVSPQAAAAAPLAVAQPEYGAPLQAPHPAPAAAAAPTGAPEWPPRLSPIITSRGDQRPPLPPAPSPSAGGPSTLSGASVPSSPTGTGRLLPAPPLDISLQRQQSFADRIQAQIDHQLATLRQFMIIPTPAQAPSLQPMAPETAQAPPLLGEGITTAPAPPLATQAPLAPEIPPAPLPPPQLAPTIEIEEQRLQELRQGLAAALGVSPSLLTGEFSITLPQQTPEGVPPPQQQEGGPVPVPQAVPTLVLPSGPTPLQLAQEQLDMAEQLHAALMHVGAPYSQPTGFRLVIPQIIPAQPRPQPPPLVPAVPAVVVTQASPQQAPAASLPTAQQQYLEQLGFIQAGLQPPQPQFGGAPAEQVGLALSPPSLPAVMVPPHPQVTSEFQSGQMVLLQALRAAQALFQEGGGRGSTAGGTGGAGTAAVGPAVMGLAAAQISPPFRLTSAFSSAYATHTQPQQAHPATCAFQPLPPLNLPQIIVVPHSVVQQQPAVPPLPLPQYPQQQETIGSAPPPPSAALEQSQSLMVSSAMGPPGPSQPPAGAPSGGGGGGGGVSAIPPPPPSTSNVPPERSQDGSSLHGTDPERTTAGENGQSQE